MALIINDHLAERRVKAEAVSGGPGVKRRAGGAAGAGGGILENFWNFETLKLCNFWNFVTFATFNVKTFKQGARAREGCWSARRVAGGKAGGEELTAMEITSWFSTKSSTPPSTTSMRSWSFLEEGLSARSHPQRVETFLSITFFCNRWPSAGRKARTKLSP